MKPQKQEKRMREAKGGFSFLPEGWQHSDITACLFFWAFFFVYSVVLLLVGKNRFLFRFFSGIAEDFGILDANSGSELYAPIIIATVLFAVMVLCIGYVYENGYDAADHSAPLVGPYKWETEGKISSGSFSPCWFAFVFIPAMPFYWVWRGLRNIKLHLVFELCVLVSLFLLPFRAISAVVVVVYGVFATILVMDDEVSDFGWASRLLLSCFLVVVFSFLLV